MKNLKKLFLALSLIVISALSASAQYDPNTLSWQNKFSGITVSPSTTLPTGYKSMVRSTTTGEMQYAISTYLQKPTLASIETASHQVDTCTGSYVCLVSHTVRDTIFLKNTKYTINQLLHFMVTASGADTTVFIPTSGSINGSANYTLTGTHAALQLYYDGTNYWILNKQ